MNAKELSREICNRWRSGATPDARAAVREHPELAEDQSAVVGLAFEEYWIRRAAGEVIDIDCYCDEFPGCRTALRNLLSIDRLIGENPQLFDDLPTDLDLQAGDVIRGCELKRELGRGAFAVVWLAHDREGDRPVVLKVSRLKTGEGRVLGKLHHEHIVRMLWVESDEEQQRYIVCMPFVGAATLTQVLDRLYRMEGDVPPETGSTLVAAVSAESREGDPAPTWQLAGPSLEGVSFAQAVARVGRSLAGTLAFLHNRDLAHGDLKPSNVLMSEGGRPLLLDFNLSRGGQDQRQVGGTLPYMSPEQLRTLTEEKPTSLLPQQGAASDVYSLGVILYEMLTGRHPFGAPPMGPVQQSAHLMLERQQSGYEPIRERNPQVPARLAGLIDRCLSADWKARPKADELERALRESRSHWRTALVGVLALVLGLAVLGWAARPTAGGQERSEVSPEPTEDVSRARGRAALKEARSLFAAGKDQKAREQLQLADDAFGDSIKARLNSGGKKGAARDYLDRGVARLLLGERGQARVFFDDALGASTDKGFRAEVLAYLAYEHALAKDHPRAVAYGEQTLAAGVRTPAVLNNLAYSLLRGRKGDAQALDYLDESIKSNGNHLLAAYHNRAWLVYQRCQRANSRQPAQVCQDIDQAIALSAARGLPEAAELYRLGAVIYVKAALDVPGREGEDWDRHQALARRYAVRAYVLGAPPQSIKTERNIATVLGENFDPRFDQNGQEVKQERELPVSGQDTYLVEPRLD